MAVRKALVDVLVEAGFADDKSVRTLMVGELRGVLDHPFTFSDQLAGRDQLIEIVSACCRLDEGLIKLALVLDFLRPGTKECDEVRKIVAAVGRIEAERRAPVPRGPVAELVPDTEQEKVRQRLVGFVPPGLSAAVRRAARYAPPQSRFEDAAEAFAGLADFNAGSDELPPLLIFVELVARECEPRLAAELRAWLNAQVRKLRLEAALEKLRAEPAGSGDAQGPLHLMIVVWPDAIEDDLYRLCSWCQVDAVWPPPAGETLLVNRDQLEESVDGLISEAEEAWAGATADVVLEFVLPRRLLDLPVHAWVTERASGAPRPLYFGYPTIIRSLERMASPRWHRVWRRRWASWIRDHSFERVYFCQSGDQEDRYRLEARLTDEQWGMAVLTESPPVSAIPEHDELLPALRAGLPVIVWHPSAPSVALREVLSWLAGSSGGLGDLPALTRNYRLDALRNSPTSEGGGVVTDLVVLWDDPTRLLPADETGIIGPPEGGADERDRVY
jgi:hypothetical protein